MDETMQILQDEPNESLFDAFVELEDDARLWIAERVAFSMQFANGSMNLGKRKHWVRGDSRSGWRDCVWILGTACASAAI